jgi:hypothetical protein
MATISQKLRKKTATVRGDAYPMPDKAHAANAKARINQAKPPLSPAEKSKVLNRANRMLGKGKKKKKRTGLATYSSQRSGMHGKGSGY